MRFSAPHYQNKSILKRLLLTFPIMVISIMHDEHIHKIIMHLRPIKTFMNVYSHARQLVTRFIKYYKCGHNV